MKKIFNIKTKSFLAIAFIALLTLWSCNDDDDVVRLTIQSIDIDTGVQGDVVVITGTGFGASSSDNVVRFNGTEAPILSSTTTSITTEVPFRASPGNITVTYNNEEAPGPFFTVQLPPPVTVAFSSFEEPQGIDVDYRDTGDPAVDRYLVNNPGQAPIEYISTGSELGFRTFYKSTGSNGLTDGDDVGVTTKTSIVGDSAEGGYADGVQGYYMDDTDGILIIEMEDAMIPADTYTVLTLEMNYLFNDTGWEDSDYLKISVVATSTGETMTLLNLDGDDIDGVNGDDLDPEPHVWHKLSKDISAFRDLGGIQLLIEFKSNSSSEEVYFDNIKFIGQ